MGRLDDIRLSFNEAAAIYDVVRPSYPPALFDALFAALPPQPDIVEVGPGTGQATKDLLARGATVLAIEIGAAIAATLRSNLPTDRLRVSVADFEKVTNPTASADAVFSASAYHWISPAAQTGRPASILRPGGVIAIVDLIQVDSPLDRGFFAAAQPIYDRYGQGHQGPPAPRRDAVDPPMHAVLEGDGRFEHVTVLRYDWDQTYSASEYRNKSSPPVSACCFPPRASHALQCWSLNKDRGSAMRVVVSEFTSLDGVAQAPGGPQEDTSGGFRHGGWSIPFFDPAVMGAVMGEVAERSDALLQGRRTYQVSAAAWPERSGDPFADWINGIQKYVVSDTLAESDLTWTPATIIRGADLVKEVSELRRRPGGDIYVYGSLTLVRALLEAELIDELILMIEPITLGGGKTLFPNDGAMRRFELTSTQTAATGVLVCRYQPTH